MRPFTPPVRGCHSCSMTPTHETPSTPSPNDPAEGDFTGGVLFVAFTFDSDVASERTLKAVKDQIAAGDIGLELTDEERQKVVEAADGLTPESRQMAREISSVGTRAGINYVGEALNEVVNNSGYLWEMLGVTGLATATMMTDNRNVAAEEAARVDDYLDHVLEIPGK